jgi:hypothetical protein
MNAKESETLFNLVRDRYGDRLSPKELEEVKKGVERITETAKALREVKLENWDEPFSIFNPFSKGE